MTTDDKTLRKRTRYIEMRLNVPVVKGRNPTRIHSIMFHPKHGRVYITAGVYLVDGRVSNHWSWRRVEGGKKTAKCVGT